jgi:CRISPR-associated endonuclease Csn1
MKKILGLDLGSSSIGWAYIEENNHKSCIKRLGVRVIPYSGDEKDQFTKGQAISTNKDRTLKRTARKTNQRYKLRKKELTKILDQYGMYPDEQLMKKLTPVQLYQLRSRAASEKVELQEIGRIFFLLNQKRGYQSSRVNKEEGDTGKKLSDYLQDLKDRKELLIENNLTIGQYFFKEFETNPFFQTRKKVFPRECYINEFDAIWNRQSLYYPNIFTDELRTTIRDRVIFYQRRLKSQKHLVGECSFEKHHKVTARSSPLFQICKIWESINNITLTDKYKNNYVISIDQKKKIFEHLNDNPRLTYTDLMKILALRKNAGWHPNDQIKKAGLQGNTTRVEILNSFRKKEEIEKFHHLLEFELKVESIIDKKTGEIMDRLIVTDEFERTPYYQIWHILYSIEELEVAKRILINKYDIPAEIAENLVTLDFKSSGFGNKSARAIRKILPQLMNGLDYSKASEKAGYNHSFSVTSEENEKRDLDSHLSQITRNSLRQPVVEKILNQLVNLINAILADPELGRPDEIRVELARELKQSKDERNKTYSRNIDQEKEHKRIFERLNQDFPGLPVTSKVLLKYKLFEQQNGICLYSGKTMELSKVLKGESIDVDHIIPQSKLFDDSFQNKLLCLRSENEIKDNATAYDYMQSKSSLEFDQFIERVNLLFDNQRITRSKRNKLLMTEQEIPDDFITRQLNETRFISKEATKILKNICRNVYSTTGMVTSYLRDQWGYNEILKQLNYHKYDAAGLTKDGKIQGWSKRDDHRHHAIDALVVACTKQSFIQRLNTLKDGSTRDIMLAEVMESGNDWQKRKSLLEENTQKNRPFETSEVKKAVDDILISIKSGKKLATAAINKANGQKVLVPRGQLHKEQVYGKIKRYRSEKTPLNGRFNQQDLIANPIEKKLVIDRLMKFGNDPKKAFSKLEADPIWLDEAKTRSISAVTLWEDVFVYKYSLDQNFKEKDIESIIDVGVREKVRARFIEKSSQKDHPLKNLANEPIWLNDKKTIPITSVRCDTGLQDLVPLHQTINGTTTNLRDAAIDSIPVDYISTRNNHHTAIYQKPDGKYEERTVTLWEAIQRKKLNIPVIMKNPQVEWDKIIENGIEDQVLLNNLPLPDWKFIESLQQNELFVFGISRHELEVAIEKKNWSLISPIIYRVQKLSKKDYWFRHHLETRLEKDSFEEKISVMVKKIIRITSLEVYNKLNPVKVSITPTGTISIIRK